MPDLYPSGHRYIIIHSYRQLYWVFPFNPKSYGKFHEYLLFCIRLSVGQNKIYRIDVKVFEDDQGNSGPDRYPVGQ